MNAIEQVMEKIRKAIRLANRTDEAGERETAMSLARNLAERNGIALDSVDVGDSEADRAVHDEGTEYRTMSGPEVGFACYILKRHFAVEVMLHQSREKANRYRVSWFGSPLNIDIAKHVFHILIRESRRAFRAEEGRMRIAVETEYAKRVNELRKNLAAWGADNDFVDGTVACIRKGRVDRRAFLTGFFSAIDAKLTERPLRNDLERDRAAAERAVTLYVGGHKVKWRRSRGGRMDARAFNAGLASGRAVNLARPCEGRESASPLAIAS